MPDKPYDHIERRSKEERTAAAQTARDADKARTESLGGTRTRSRTPEERAAEKTAVQEAARREKARVDSESAAARADKNATAPSMVGQGGTKVTGDEIVKQADVKGLPEGFGPIRRNLCVNGFAGSHFVLGTTPTQNSAPAP